MNIWGYRYAVITVKSALYDQVPQDEKGAQPRGSKEGVPSRAGPPRTLLQLFVPLADAFGRLERVGNQLIDVRRLRGEVADEQVLELGNLDERVLSGSASRLERRIGDGLWVCSNSPDFIQGALEVFEHVLVALFKQLFLAVGEVVHRRPLFLLFLHW